MKNIKVIATSIEGLRNKSKKEPCQDHFKFSQKEKNFVAIIADGAGSAKYGKIGARIVCETIVDLLKNAPFSKIEEKTKEAILIAREKISYHRFFQKDKQIREFASTVLGAVYHKNYGGVFFHIGDGAGIVFHDKILKNSH